MKHFTWRIIRPVIIVSILPFCLALQGWSGPGTAVDGSASLFDRAMWETNLAFPDATGQISLDGFDISQRWPGQRVDGWFMSINATRNDPYASR
jgi:hypothetical protein